MGASQWCGAEGADVTRERAISVAEVTPSGFAGLSFHTSKYMDGPTCPPLLIFMCMCTILFFFLLALNVSFLIWYWAGGKTLLQLISETFMINSAILRSLQEQRLLKTFMTNPDNC